MVPIAAIQSNNEAEHKRTDIDSCFIVALSFFLCSLLSSKRLKMVEMTATRPITITGIEPCNPVSLNPLTTLYHLDNSGTDG